MTPVRFDPNPSSVGTTVRGLPASMAGDTTPRTLLLVADPFSTPVDGFLESAPETYPGLRVVGGLASAARGPGGNRLVLDDQVFTDGAVGVLLAPEDGANAVVSQGCRPIGQPLTVTKSEGRVIYELAGRPALERLVELLEKLEPDDRALAQQGIHLGRVIDEHKADFGRGDFLIRTVLGGDREVGAIAVGDEIEVGATVQFQVRDAVSADEDLRELLTGTAGERRARVHVQRPRHPSVRAARPRCRGRQRARRQRRHGGHVLCRRARPDRRPQLPARLHRVGSLVRGLRCRRAEPLIEGNAG